MRSQSGGARYRMLPSKDDNPTSQEATLVSEDAELETLELWSRVKVTLDRKTYFGSLLFNVGAFALPALYGTLSKLWIAQIDSSKVVTTDVYTYIGVIVEVFNDGLPRTAWVVIGDKANRSTSSRISLTHTLITTQAILGALLMVVFLGSASRLAGAFVPAEVRETSLTYVRISSVQALSSALEVSVATSTRALDHPDVPLLISSVKFVVNIILDLLIISKVHVGSHQPSINAQAWIRMACDLTAALTGLAYFLFIAVRMQKPEPELKARPGIRCLKLLLRPGLWTFLESALRNAIYLWLIHNIISMGANYATAWGVFNTIRWGMVMVPVQSLEASTLAAVGHAWGKWRGEIGPEFREPKVSRKDLLNITRYSWISCGIALLVEVPFCLFLSLWGIKGFAHYLSNSETVSVITQRMWKTIDWCYIFYALNTQVAAILLASVPRWYFYQALGSNFLWMLPWAIAVSEIHMDEDNAWTYHSIIFGGSLVFSFFTVSIVCSTWAWLLTRGKVKLPLLLRSF
ncbi:hypothetical protein B0O99DRAFT_549470 [Bisporella sp. PMI_857]|nr:hypothetical protein B0O99DRAFT_549470 [Bisporella sp. PMI_857]